MEQNFIQINIKIVCILSILGFCLTLAAFGQSHSDHIRGVVYDSSTGEALRNVSVSVDNTTVSTTADGRFEIEISKGDFILTASHVGYHQKTLVFTVEDTIRAITIHLEQRENVLQEVEVSTGYQQLSRERITGSFEHVDNELFNSRVGQTVLQRLDGRVSGLLFINPDGGVLNVRGRNTIFSNDQPLIVVDNFAYDGDIGLINPADIEDISVLKDAAAASIWGARAGNGVIVIRTKRGGINQRTSIDYSTFLGVKGKPDLFNKPVLNSAEFIEFERQLFDLGAYAAAERLAFPTPFTPVVELLIARRDGHITTEEMEGQINILKGYDVRNDFTQHFYTNTYQQQHAVNLRGGSGAANWYYGAGYDRNVGGNVNYQDSRLSLRANNSFQIHPDVVINNQFTFTQSTNTDRFLPGGLTYNAFTLGSGGRTAYPYARLMDEGGGHLALEKDWRQHFKDLAFDRGLNNWDYFPLTELLDNESERVVGSTDFLINPSLIYKPFDFLNISLNYQYQKYVRRDQTQRSAESYDVRSLINRYTQVDNDGSIHRPIPDGDILMTGNQEMRSHQGRLQVGYTNDWGADGLDAIIGIEVRDKWTYGNSSQLYGYQEKGLIHNGALDFQSRFRFYDSALSGQIPRGESLVDLTNRFLSYYGNVAYNIKGRYVISGSTRVDKSNMFGVSTNRRMVPLWSLGALWHIHDEPFIDNTLFSRLSVRATYGVNGNVSDAVGITTLAYRGQAFLSNLTQAAIVTPPNNSLRWEKNQNINIGLDFVLGQNDISGSIEYYVKKNTDLLSQADINPVMGLGDLGGKSVYFGNVASTKGYGLDVTLSVNSIASGSFKWIPSILFSLARTKVEDYFAELTTANQYINANTTVTPRIGYPVFSVFSYPWAGLDPSDGQPRGLLNGEISKDYTAIGASSIETLVYHGPAQAPVFGSLRNAFSYKNFHLAININYRFGYYYRRTAVPYSSIVNSWTGHSDFSLRWKQPGDELHTDFPAFSYPVNTAGFNFYAGSSARIEKGDHIRLQDIQLGYNLIIHKKRSGTNNFNIRINANNIGYIWLANSQREDPFSENNIRQRATYTLGVMMKF